MKIEFKITREQHEVAFGILAGVATVILLLSAMHLSIKEGPFIWQDWLQVSWAVYWRVVAIGGGIFATWVTLFNLTRPSE